MSTTRAADATHPVRIETTRQRPTPAPAGHRFRAALDGSAAVLLAGIESASSLVPGGGVVSAAVRGARAGGPAATAPGAEPGAPQPGSPEEMQLSMMDDAMHYLQIQQQMQAENQRFTTLSNVMKARHETAKSAINNIR